MSGRTRVPERPGDFLRTAASMVEGFAADDLVQRATAMVRAVGPGHAECPLMPVVTFLAGRLADLAEAAEADLGAVLAQWRETAELMDRAGSAGLN